MAANGLDLLPFYAPDFYAKQLPIQRQQALAKMLMEQGGSDPGTARYGGLRNAANSIAGALLGRRADTALGQLYTGPENPGAQGGQDTGQVTNTAQTNPDVQGNVQQPYEGTDTLDLGLGQHNQGQPPVQAPAQTQQSSGPRQFSGIRGLSKQDAMFMFLNDPGKYFETIAQQHGPTELMRNIEAAYPDNPAAQQAAYQQYAQKQTLTNEQLNARAAYPGNPTGAQAALQSGFQTPEVRNALAAHDPNLPEAARADVAAEVRKAGTQIYRPGQIVDLADGRRFQMPNEEGKFALFDKDGNPIFQGILPGASGNVQELSRAGAAGSAPEQFVNVTRSDGSVVPMRVGTAVGIAQRSNFAPQQPPPLLGKGPITGQPAPAAQPPPLGIGQSSAAAALAPKIADAAADDARVQSLTDQALSSLQRLRAINAQTPDSTYTSPEQKADWAKRFGSETLTKNTTLWNQENENSLVGVVEQLKNTGGGRMPQQLIKEIKEARGIDINNPVGTRRAEIDNLERIIRDWKVQSHNQVARMNDPNALTERTVQPMPGQGPLPGPSVPASGLPPAARAQLRDGVTTSFKNGQKWTLQNGQPVRVQ